MLIGDGERSLGEVSKIDDEVLKAAGMSNTESELDTSWKGRAVSRHLLQHHGSSDFWSSEYSLSEMPVHLACSHAAHTSH